MEYAKILGEMVSHIGYAALRAKTSRYSVETRQLLYAESPMRMNHTQYRDIAQAYIRTALANVIRPDLSIWRTLSFNRETGRPDHGATCQGYKGGSAWARGQAWGVHGTAIGYRYTRRSPYVNLFEDVTDYLFGRLPKDLVPSQGSEFGDGSKEPRGSSAASIVACGLLEMTRYMEPGEGARCTGMVGRLMKPLAVNYTVKDYSKSSDPILHSTYPNHSPHNTCSHYGVDECNP